jgi:hypothetical protein
MAKIKTSIIQRRKLMQDAPVRMNDSGTCTATRAKSVQPVRASFTAAQEEVGMGKSGGYLGGHTVITVRQSDASMERRAAHWRRKIARQQEAFDTANKLVDPDSLRDVHCPRCRKIRPIWLMKKGVCFDCTTALT